MTPEHMKMVQKKTKPVIIRFDPPNCPDCLKLDEFWDMAGQNFPPATIWRCACAKYQALCDDMIARTDQQAAFGGLQDSKRILHQVPTIEAWTGSKWIRYAGGKDLPSLLNWMREVMAGNVIAAAKEHVPYDGPEANGNVPVSELEAAGRLLEQQVANMVRLFREDAGRDEEPQPAHSGPLPSTQSGVGTPPPPPPPPPLPPSPPKPSAPMKREPPSHGSAALRFGEGEDETKHHTVQDRNPSLPGHATVRQAVDPGGHTGPIGSTADMPTYGSSGFSL